MTTTNNQSAARPAGLVSCAQMMQDFNRRRHDMRAVTPTGIRALDQALRGGMRSELLLAGGKAGVGKTDLAVNIALSFAQTRQVIFVTIELSPNQILFRTVTSFGAHLGKDGALTEQQILQGGPDCQPTLACTMAAFAGDARNLFIADDTTASPATEKLLTGEGLREYVARQTERGVKCAVIVDYLQQMRCEKFRDAPGVDTLDYIAKSLATLAHNQGTPVVALTSLSAQGDPRGSTHLLHAADIYLLLECSPALQGRRQRPVTGHLRKNRGGLSGVDIELRYTPELHRFA